MKKKRKYLNSEDKKEILRLHYLEGVIQSDLARKFGYSNMTISRLIRKFAAEKDKSFLFMKKKTTSSQEEELKALREEVLELKKRLYHETMRADFYDTMIDVAEEMLNIEIRKKVGTGQPKGCMKTK